MAAPFSEDVGGLGGGPLSTMIIMQEFGRHLVVEPFVETVVLAGGLIEQLGSAEQKQGFIPDIIAGEKIWALAWTEKGSRFDLANVATTARREGKDYVLSGEKTAVIAAPWADYLIVSARTSGHRHDRGGVSLFVVDRHAANLRPAELQDHRRPARRRDQPDATSAASNCSAAKARAWPRWKPAATAPSARSARKRSARWPN